MPQNFGHFGQIPPGLFADPNILKAIASSQPQQAAVPQGPGQLMPQQPQGLPQPGQPIMPQGQRLPPMAGQNLGGPLINGRQMNPNDPSQARLLQQHMLSQRQAEMQQQALEGSVEDAAVRGAAAQPDFFTKAFGGKLQAIQAGLDMMAASADQGFGKQRPSLGSVMRVGMQHVMANAANQQDLQQKQMVAQAFEQGNLPAVYDHYMAQGDIENAKAVKAMMATDAEEGFTLNPGQARFNARNELVALLPKDEEGKPNLTYKEATQVTNELRDDYRTELQQQGANDVVAFYQNGRQGYARGDGVGDVMLVQAMAKLNDPGSVVREGEFRVWGERMGLGDKLLGALERLDQGEILSPDLREALKDALEDMYQTRVRRFQPVHDSYVKQYNGMGIRDHLDLEAEDVLVNPFPTAAEVDARFNPNPPNLPGMGAQPGTVQTEFDKRMEGS